MAPAMVACVCFQPAIGRAGDDPVPDAGLLTDAAMEVWGYMNAVSLERDSTLNPANAIARLPSSQRLIDARLNVWIRDDLTELVLQPRFLAEHRSLPAGQESDGTAYLSQGFIRVRPDQHVTLSGGRYRFTWGPANFRSPSNPFYFDPGKNQPLRDVPGIDLLRADYSSKSMQITAAYITDAGHLSARPDIDQVYLLKVDYRGKDGLASAVGSTRSGGKPFFGTFAQHPFTDAVMMYAEYGHGQRPGTLKLPVTGSGSLPLPESPSDSASSALVGSAYTLLNGQILSFEYLYDRHGFQRDGEARYFEWAQQYAAVFRSAPSGALRGQAAAGLGQLMAYAPAMMGRHYAYLLWQSNPQESSLYWRASLARNMQDGGTQALLYAEKNVSQRVSVFASAMINDGGAKSEFGANTSHAMSVGLKLFLF